MAVTTPSRKPSADISGLDVNIICFRTLNVACDNHYMKLLGRSNQTSVLAKQTKNGSRCTGTVDQMGADVLGVDVMALIH